MKYLLQLLSLHKHSSSCAEKMADPHIHINEITTRCVHKDVFVI